MLYWPCWDNMPKYVWDNIAQKSYLFNVGPERADILSQENQVFQVCLVEYFLTRYNVGSEAHLRLSGQQWTEPTLTRTEGYENKHKCENNTYFPQIMAYTNFDRTVKRIILSGIFSSWSALKRIKPMNRSFSGISTCIKNQNF